MQTEVGRSVTDFARESMSHAPRVSCCGVAQVTTDEFDAAFAIPECRQGRGDRVYESIRCVQTLCWFVVTSWAPLPR